MKVSSGLAVIDCTVLKTTNKLWKRVKDYILLHVPIEGRKTLIIILFWRRKQILTVKTPTRFTPIESTR